MQTLAAFLIAEHMKDIQREADAVRLAQVEVTERTRPAWRRSLGTAARRLSGALDELAAELDPACRPSYGRE
jgi:hypothetical protein